MLNLAAYGLVIGHEMTHGFDNSGRLYDAIGQQRDWWTESDKAEFQARSQCFIDQYSAFKLFNQSMDGENTLGENIAESDKRAMQRCMAMQWMRESHVRDCSRRDAPRWLAG